MNKTKEAKLFLQVDGEMIEVYTAKMATAEISVSEQSVYGLMKRGRVRSWQLHKVKYVDAIELRLHARDAINTVMLTEPEPTTDENGEDTSWIA